MIAHQRANANNPAESGLALCEIEPPAKTIGGQMPCKLYVGNLAHSVSNDDLHQLFSEVGQVQSATVMTDKFSGQSKGFGFVAMTTAEEVANANRQFNDTELKRRNIKVNEAKPRELKFGGGNRDRSGGGSRGRPYEEFLRPARRTA